MNNGNNSILFNILLVIIIAVVLFLLYKLVNILRAHLKANKEKQDSIDYLKNNIDEKEINFLNKHFYNEEENLYKESVKFDFISGEGVNTANSLIRNGVIYRPLRLDCDDGYCFSLYPHVMEYLNKRASKLEIE